MVATKPLRSGAETRPRLPAARARTLFQPIRHWFRHQSADLSGPRNPLQNRFFRIEVNLHKQLTRHLGNPLRREQVEIPVRHLGQGIVWKVPTETGLNALLHNPIYAGAYAFGRRRQETWIENGRKRVRGGILKSGPEEWTVLLRERHEAYITWEEYERNQATIPHTEKVLSIFEPHRRWCSKGKAGRPVELGVPVAVVESAQQFVLHWQVMWAGEDVDVACPLVAATQTLYPSLEQCSFDKGFHSPANQVRLDALLELNALPRKGRLSKAERKRAEAPAFRAARRAHAGVESAINNLEQRGLGRVLARGADGFERMVGLAVRAGNLHRIGLLLQRAERARLKRARAPAAAGRACGWPRSVGEREQRTSRRRGEPAVRPRGESPP